MVSLPRFGRWRKRVCKVKIVDQSGDTESVRPQFGSKFENLIGSRSGASVSSLGTTHFPFYFIIYGQEVR